MQRFRKLAEFLLGHEIFEMDDAGTRELVQTL
jgi:hypothetical protein